MSESPRPSPGAVEVPPPGPPAPQYGQVAYLPPGYVPVGNAPPGYPVPPQPPYAAPPYAAPHQYLPQQSPGHGYAAAHGAPYPAAPYGGPPYGAARGGRSGGRVIALVVILCLTLVCALGGVVALLVTVQDAARTGTSDGGTATGPQDDEAVGPGGGRTRPEELTPEEQFDRDVGAGLAARTAALRSRNERAFLAVVDPTDRVLLARQRQLFRNLIQFPLVEPVFRDVEDGGSRSGAVPGGRDFGVALVHRLGRADVEPVAMGYRETWVRRGTAVVLTESSPERGLARSRTAGPIDDTALRVAGGGLVTVAGGPDVTAAALAKVDRLAEKAAVPVRRMWGSRPGPQGFVVFLTRSKRAKGSWYGGTTVAGSSGFCASLYNAGDGGARDAPVRFAGARIVIDMTKTRDDTDLASTLRHEFTHAQAVRVQAVRQPSSSGQVYPVWAEEGFASWSEERDVPLSRSERLLHLRYLAQRGYFRTGLPPSGATEFYASSEEVIGLNYAKAAMVFRYVAERWGPERAVALYCRIASGQGGSAQAVLGISAESFEKGWTAWLVRQVRAGR